MIRKDFRSYILPTTIGNTDENQRMENLEFDTTDLIWLDSLEEQLEKTEMERRVSATDYALMNYAGISDNITTRTGRHTTLYVVLRSARYNGNVYYVIEDGSFEIEDCTYNFAGLCPSLHYYLPDESEKPEQLDIREVKDLDRKNYISYTTNW